VKIKADIVLTMQNKGSAIEVHTITIVQCLVIAVAHLVHARITAIIVVAGPAGVIVTDITAAIMDTITITAQFLVISVRFIQPLYPMLNVPIMKG